MAKPLTYKKEYCEMLEKHMEEGYSFEAFGGIIGTSRITLHRWREKYEEFRDAFERGYCKSLVYYEKLGKGAMLGKIPNFNTAIYCFNMKNRFGWSDKVEQTITGEAQVVINYSLHSDGN